MLCPYTFLAGMTAALNQTSPDLINNLQKLGTEFCPDNSSKSRLEGKCVLLCMLAYQCADKILNPEFQTKSIKLLLLKSVKSKAIKR